MKDEYEGAWLSTLHVPHFHFLKPAPDEIDIRDIAHALSMSCRFGGHGKFYLSVAEHSVAVAWILFQLKADSKTVLAGLLHDAEEAYLPDIPSPIKFYMPEAKAIYKKLNLAIREEFDIIDADWKLVEDIDHRIVITEGKALGLWNSDWAVPGPDLPAEIYGWLPTTAESRFLEVYEGLGGVIPE